MDIKKYWRVTLEQNPNEMRKFFSKDVLINWHNTKESFTLEEFIQANCEYPGSWDGTIEKVIRVEDMIITAVHVFSKEENLSFHVTSFFEIYEDKIIKIDEYWGEDGKPPTWRLEKKIGRPIK